MCFQGQETNSSVKFDGFDSFFKFFFYSEWPQNYKRNHFLPIRRHIFFLQNFIFVINQRLTILQEKKKGMKKMRILFHFCPHMENKIIFISQKNKSWYLIPLVTVLLPLLYLNVEYFYIFQAFFYEYMCS